MIKLVAINRKDIKYSRDLLTEPVGEIPFSDIRWRDIFFRKIRLVALPRNLEVEGITQKIKRKLCKILVIEISERLIEESIKKIFSCISEKSIIITSGEHVVEIYRFHFPQAIVFNGRGIYKKEKIYTKKINMAIDWSRGKVMFVNANSRDFLLIRKYRELHPNKYIILRYHDKISSIFSLDALIIKNILKYLSKEGVVNEINSYDINDAKLLEIDYLPNAVNPCQLAKKDYAFRSSLCLFIGSEGNNRENILSLVMGNLVKYSENVDKWIKVKITKKDNDFIGYDEYIDLFGKNEICLDLIRLDPDEGYPYRIPEALFLNRKIITNRKALVNENFYSKDRIFIIGVDNNANLKNFLEGNLAPLPNAVLERFNSLYW